jgi:hypothetical protein
VSGEINYEKRNDDLLEDFYAYCKKHPQLRFWQALLNWSGYRYIFITKERPVHHNECFIWREHEIHDPYYWEGKDKYEKQ